MIVSWAGMSGRCVSSWLQLKNRIPLAVRFERWNGYAQATETEPIVGTHACQSKEVLPDALPPSEHDLHHLFQFVEESRRLVVLTGAGVSTESGIPDYRSPRGAYSSGFKPITHQEYIRSPATRRRYWARSYAGWRRFIAAQPGRTHKALAQLEATGRIMGMITQNVDRLHHRAGSSPIELHGTTHRVICLSCGNATGRYEFQDRVCDLNPEWALAIQMLEKGEPGSSGSFGMKQRPDGDIEIDSKFFQEDFLVPGCERCGGVLKPDVVFFGDNVPKSRADEAMGMIKGGDAILVVGSSLMVMSAFRLIRPGRTRGNNTGRLKTLRHTLSKLMINPEILQGFLPTDTFIGKARLCFVSKRSQCRMFLPPTAVEQGTSVAIINIGATRADDMATLKVESRSGEVSSLDTDDGLWLMSGDVDAEVMSRLLTMGALTLPRM